MSNYIYEYYQQIQEGTTIVGKWVRIWYGIIIKGLESKLFYYDAKKAKKAIRFIENFCHHHEGALAPETIKLELWQKALVSVIFAIVDENGLRQFREVIIIMGRKNGKTLLAAAISAYCMFLDGEYGARIYFAAPKLDQANLCFDAFYQMIQSEPELDAVSQKRRTDIYVASSNSSAKSIAFNANKSDGFNIHLCVADEISSWKGAQGLKFYEVLKSSFGARLQPMLLSISTAGYENEGIYDELMKRATRVLLGDSKETRLAPFLYTIDDVEKWNDITELQKSNPNLGVSVSVDYLLEEIAVAEGSLSKKAEFITKYCNIKQNSSQAWLTAQTVELCMGDHLSPDMFRGSYCVGGIDLSQTTDLTSACVVIEKDSKLYVLSKFWMPAERVEFATARDSIPYDIYIKKGYIEPSGANFVDYNDCFDWFRRLVEDYEILPLKVGYDRYSAQYLIKQMQGYGFHCDDVYQGDNLWPIIQQCEGLMKDGVICIGDNDLLKLHALDSAVKINTDRGRGRLIKVRPTAHIDGMASLLDALCVRDKYYNEIGNQLKNE